MKLDTGLGQVEVSETNDPTRELLIQGVRWSEVLFNGLDVRPVSHLGGIMRFNSDPSAEWAEHYGTVSEFEQATALQFRLHEHVLILAADDELAIVSKSLGLQRQIIIHRAPDEVHSMKTAFRWIAASAPPPSDPAPGRSNADFPDPVFVHYVQGESIQPGAATVIAGGRFDAIRTLDGDTVQPRTYVRVPIAELRGINGVNEVQLLLDNVAGHKDAVMSAAITGSECTHWQRLSRPQVEECLTRVLGELQRSTGCRVVEAVMTTTRGDVIRLDQPGTDSGRAAPSAASGAKHAMTAALRGDLDQLVRAVDSGLDPNAIFEGNPILHGAVMAERNRVGLTTWLLDRGANPEVTDQNGWTALHTACEVVDAAVIDLLIARSANAAAVDNKGWTPLHYLTLNKSGPALIESLARAGASVDAQSKKDGNTALMLAVDAQDMDRVGVLLSVGANANVERPDGVTALHMAVNKPNVAIARQLLQAGASPAHRMPGTRGTPLHYAAAYGSVPLIELLIKSGADPTLTDHAGKTPHAVAVGRGHAAAAAHLESLGAGSNKTPPRGPVPPLKADLAQPEGSKAADTPTKEPAAKRRWWKLW